MEVKRLLLAGRRNGRRLADGADLLCEPSTAGERLADYVTRWLGSWPFIVAQGALLLLWISLNTVAWRQHWDPYPFILLNLALSFQAAFSAPIIMMSQNRQATKDRYKAEADYLVDRQAEGDIAAVHSRLDDLSGRQWEALIALQQQQLEILWRVETLMRELRPGAIAIQSLRNQDRSDV